MDASLAAGSDVGFSTRDAQTHLFLEDGQTIILAGLIKQSRSENFNKVPFLGDLPIIGLLFRSKANATADKDTELVISLTPTVLKVEPKAPEVAEATEEGRGGRKMASSQGMDQEASEELTVPANETTDEQDDQESLEDAAEEGTSENETLAGEAGAGAQESFSEKDEALSDSTTGSVSEDSIQSEAASEDEAQSTSGSENASSEAVSDTSGSEKTSGEATLDSSVKPSIDLAVTAETPEGEDVSDLMANYVNALQRKISQAISFPYEASEKGWRGTVKLNLHILKDGTLDEVKVKESSGYPLFDKDAVDTTQILAPFDPFPPELNLQELIITVPIIYSQDKASADLTEICEIDTTSIRQGTRPFIPSGATYTQLVQERIAKSAIYPKQAKQLGWEGTVKLNLKISRDGSLESASVKESSGFKIFDECALKTAKMVAPYSTFPADSHLKELSVTVPITYSLERK
ncbi:MAG: hypothetical protein A2Z88_07335 [Omnitrophica WOR_2 bacterium GWA2_47_8]|nr:MAG: hypothetical protein A2Z88_07335 [Omnitrophica WOR_2 bacterium GWA2_47_8]